MDIGQLFNTVLVIPIINILLVFYNLFLLVKLPFAFGFSIIALTGFIRFLLQPFFHQQLTMSSKMQEMKPHIDKLNEKHKNDKQRLQQEQLKLYKDMGVNPASGCLFTLVQLPIFIALYQVLNQFLMGTSSTAVAAQMNKIVYFSFLKISTIDPNFFGFNLYISPDKFAKYGVWYLLLPVMTAVLQYLQVKVTMPPAPAQAVAKSKSTLKKSDKKQDSEDMQKIMNTQMKFIFPLMIGWFSYTLPVGLSLYWNIFSIFSIIQYRTLKKAKVVKTI